MDSLKGTLTPMKVLNGTLNGGIAYGTFNYNELENKPSVNGTELVGDVTIDIPTKTSDLDNDSGFITDADVPTKTSELDNDSGFITNADVPTKTSELDNDSGFITEEDIPEIPTNTSQLNNDSGFLTMLKIPVKSVNSQTGDVDLFIPNATSQLTNDAGFLTDNDIPVQSVNGQTGEVELTAKNIPLSSTDDTDTASAIEANKVKSVFLATTYSCSYTDSNTIGYRGTGPNITTLTGYPTGKNILAVVIERSYVENKIYPAITSLDTNILYTESKNSGTAYIGMRVLYTD